MANASRSLGESVLKHVRCDFPLLKQHLTVQEALTTIRERGVGDRVMYFYVVDDDERLVGVLPTRRLLTVSTDKQLCDVMMTSVVSIPFTATVMDACEFFVLHRFLAFPVVDDDRRVVGAIDVTLFAREVFDIASVEHSDEIFETIGFRLSEVRDASPLKAFRHRFPWLIATIASGLGCAFLAAAFQATLSQSIVLAFFLTLILGLGESVSMQSMTVTVHALRSGKPGLRRYLRALWKETGTGLALGVAAGGIVGGVAWVWQQTPGAAIVLALAIPSSLLAACLLGLSIPFLLHTLRLDPKIAAGPVTLAAIDVLTLLFYFSIATAALGAG